MAGFVQIISANASQTTTVISTLTATPAANSLIVVASRTSGGGAMSTVSDSKGNTWAFKQSGLVATSTRVILSWTTQDVAPLVSGDTITLTNTLVQTITACTYEFSPCLATDDVDGVNTATSATSVVVPVASLNTTFANDVVVTAIAHTTSGTASAWSINNGFTIHDTSVSTTRIVASKAVAATGDQQATWSWTGAIGTAGVMVAFKQAAGNKGLLVNKTAVQRAASF